MTVGIRKVLFGNKAIKCTLFTFSENNGLQLQNRILLQNKILLNKLLETGHAQMASSGTYKTFFSMCYNC